MTVTDLNIMQFCIETEADMEMVIDYVESNMHNPTCDDIDEAISIYQDYLYNNGLIVDETYSQWRDFFLRVFFHISIKRRNE